MERQLGTQSADRAVAYFALVDAMDGIDSGMKCQHRRGFAINQRINLEVGVIGLENGENGRCQQNIPVVAELRDEHPPDAREVRRIVGSGQVVWVRLCGHRGLV